jgi:hypothetical protein
MGALAVNQLLETAQNKGLELAIETAHLENQLLLEEVDKMSLDALPKNPKRGVALVILTFYRFTKYCLYQYLFMYCLIFFLRIL